MKKYIQLLLYSLAFVGILINLLYDVKPLGLIGYVCLGITSIIQIAKMISKKYLNLSALPHPSGGVIFVMRPHARRGVQKS